LSISTQITRPIYCADYYSKSFTDDDDDDDDKTVLFL